VTGHTPDPLLDAATRLLDTVEAELFTTAQDLADRDTSPPALGTLVAALVHRVGDQARSQGADEQFVAALTYTVWIAADGIVNRALAATAGHN
jgi:type VI protein secretion system component VasF